MTDKLEQRRSNRREIIVLACLFGIHLLMDVLIAGPIRRVDSQVLLLVIAAIPVGQVTLLALWAGLSPVRSYLRFALLTLGLVWLWFVEGRSLDFSYNVDLSTAHAMMFLTQAAIVFADASLIRVVAWRRRRRAESAPRMQVGLGFLLAWIASIAVALALGREVWIRCEWSLDVVKGRFFWFGCVVGVYNALVGLLAIWARPAGSKWFVCQLVFALLLTGLMAWSQRLALEMLFGEDGGLNALDWLTSAGSQAAILLATLIPFRMVRQRGHATNLGTKAIAGVE